jgi:hypothetical protein
MARYFLRKHVYLCVHGSEIVFLDLKEDKYLSIAASKVGGVLTPSSDFSSSEELPAAKRTADTLVKRGLLTEDASAGKPAEAMAIPPPTADLMDDKTYFDSALTPRDVIRFLRAALIGFVALRCGSLMHAVERVSKRNARFSSSARSVDLELTKQCVAKFERMRPFVFSARNQCLFESFVLLEFLSNYQLYPCWVFGVRTVPFGAHCWLQQMNVVVNDSMEHASGFTRILAV